MSPSLEGTWLYSGDIPWGPEVQSLLATTAQGSRGFPCVSCIRLLLGQSHDCFWGAPEGGLSSCQVWSAAKTQDVHQNMPPGISSLEEGSQNGAHQCWNLHCSVRQQKRLLPVSQSQERHSGAFCLTSRCSKISTWVFYGLHAFWVSVFMLVSRLTKSVCEPFKNGISFPYNSRLFLDVLPTGFESHLFGRAHLCCARPRVVVLYV